MFLIFQGDKLSKGPYPDYLKKASAPFRLLFHNKYFDSDTWHDM